MAGCRFEVHHRTHRCLLGFHDRFVAKKLTRTTISSSTHTTTLPENRGGQRGPVPSRAGGPACEKCLLAASGGPTGEGAGARDVPENHGVPGSNPGPATSKSAANGGKSKSSGSAAGAV